MEKSKEDYGIFEAPIESLIIIPSELEEFKKRGFDLVKALESLQSDILLAPKLSPAEVFIKDFLTP